MRLIDQRGRNRLGERLRAGELFGAQWRKLLAVSTGLSLGIIAIPVVMPPARTPNWSWWLWWIVFAGTLGCVAGGLGLVARWAPATRARTRTGMRRMAIASWRRSAVAALLGGPLVLASLASNWGVSGWALALFFGAGGYIAFLEVWDFNDTHFIRSGGLGPTRQCAWADIISVDARPPGMTIYLSNARVLHVRGVLFDGYPEFVQAFLKNAPRPVASDPMVRAVLEPIESMLKEQSMPRATPKSSPGAPR